MKKIIISLMVVFLCVALISGFTHSAFAESSWASQAITKVEAASGDDTTNKSVRNITGSLLAVFRIAAVGIALIMLVVVAIKYMSAAPEGKAEIKKHAVIYIVGAVVLFASAGILSIIESFATNNISAN